MTFLYTGMSSVAIVNLEILYVPDCPNRERARHRVDKALAVVGMVATIRETPIPTVEAAAGSGMRGSPTVLIDGIDAFPGDGAEASLSCRLYRSNASVDGAPSVDQLVEALAARGRS